MKRENKYPLGYLPKIEYWLIKIDEAVESNSIKDYEYAKSKVDYFVERQKEVMSNDRIN